ncbi:purine-cytosine permease family protein [Microtetraspora malaysiensis]|uniref:purine-cytosine permease family protein n=1 Tax=Microtetraspora malaysiensis TaxID=161358 RepID=UPI003D8FBA6A
MDRTRQEPSPSPASTDPDETGYGIEAHGVDTIPEAERTGHPRDIVSVLVGNNLSLGVIIFGWLPVAFGLGFWDALTSTIVGSLIGTALVAPLTLTSLRSGTNQATASGAEFGVRGRLIGSALGLVMSFGYAGLALWAAGDAVVAILDRMAGIPANGASYAVTYAVLAVPTCACAVFGYAWLVRLGRFLTVAMSIVLAIGVFAYAGDFSTAPTTDLALDTRWQTWILSTVLVGISGPMSYLTILGDYSRYISPARHRPRAVVAATAAGLLVSLLIPTVFGTFTALAARAGTDDYIGPLVAAAPGWFLIFLLANAVLGTAGNSISVYSMGLDLDAILPRWSRLRSTVVCSIITTGLVYIGHFAWNAQDVITALMVLLTATGTPWAVICLIGYVRSGGRYETEALQVYNRRATGGVYWYRAGWNPDAVIAWSAGSAVGLLAVDADIMRGPLLHLTGDIDISFLLSGVVSGLLYVGLSARKPQPMATSEAHSARHPDTSAQPPAGAAP